MLNNKVRRLTFSYDLAKFIQNKNQDHQIKFLDLIICGKATKDDNCICIYGIVDRRKGKLLRATVSWEEAVFLTQDSSRWIACCFVKNSKEVL